MRWYSITGDPLQRGSVLIESLLAILIFSLGVIAVMGMQAIAVQTSTDAKYRTDASLLANQLIARMMTDVRTASILQTNYASATAGAGYAAWVSDVQAVLPGAQANPPTVTVDTTPGATEGVVAISIFWRQAGEADDVVHNHSVVAQVR